MLPSIGGAPVPRCIVPMLGSIGVQVVFEFRAHEVYVLYDSPT